MLLNDKSIESLINIILQKKNNALYEKKEIFYLLKDTIKNNNYSNKINYLGYGSHGIVLEPPIKFNLLDEIIIDEKYNDKYVSKILYNLNEQRDSIYNEYLIGKKLKKIDENNDYFIYPIELDQISTDYSNLIMKKGYSLTEYYKKLKEIDIYKIFFNLLNGIQKLIDNNMLILDIKLENILLNKKNDNQYKSVFIDFTPELIIENKKDFFHFCDQFKEFIHPLWSFEVNYLLYQQYINTYINEEHTIKFTKYKSNIKVSDILYEKHVKDTFENDLKNNFKLFSQKLMIYQLGKMFSRLIKDHFINYDTKLYNKFKNFMKHLVTENYTKRYTIKKIKEKIIFKDDYIINI